MGWKYWVRQGFLEVKRIESRVWDEMKHHTSLMTIILGATV